MTEPALDAVDDILQVMPKIELHRHLEGSLRLGTLLEIAVTHNLDVPHTADGLGPMVKVLNNTGDYLNFLSKFHVLRQFYCSPEVIHRFAYEAVADAAIDNIRYMELRFTPRALAAARGFPLEEVSDLVIDAVNQASADFGLPCQLIISINRHEDIKIAEQATRIAIDRRDKGIVALDLAGNEADFSADPFVPLFREAREAGLHSVVHAGEWSGPENVRQAIIDLNASRIGHGVRVVEDSSVMHLARERRICFEICLTSNLQSGVVRRAGDHPLLDMFLMQLNCTLNTDDPAISNITLTDEYQLATHSMGFSVADLKKMTRIAAESALLPPDEHQKLIAQFGDWLANIPSP